jgi:PAS domain S-box-containing protein
MRRRPNRDRKLSKTRGRNAKTPKRRAASNSRRGRSSGIASETELARYIRERDAAQERQAATAEVLKVISRSTFDLQTVLDTLTKSAVQLCAADRGIIFMQDGDVYRARAVFGFSREAVQYALENPLRRDRGSATGRVALEGKAVHIPDLLADPEYTATGLKAFGYRTILSVPLQRDGTTIGIFSLTRDKVNPFTDEQIELVKTFADQAVIAIENTRLLNELRESLKQQTATADVLRVISSSPGDLEPVFGAMLENAIRICDATFGNIYRYDGEGLHLVAWHNTPAALVEDRKCSPYRPSSTTPTARALASKATVHVLDAAVEPAYTEERNPGMVAVVELGGMRTYVVVPLLKETEVIGVLTVLRQEVRAFTDKQIELLQNFAAQAVIAIENARLLNELRQLLEHHQRAEAALADSERQLRKAHDELEMNLVEAMNQQTATSEVMRIISSSPIQSVLDAVAENAARLCDANNAEIFRLEDNLLRLVASYGEIPVNIHAREGIPPKRDRVIGRATCDRRTIQVDNLATEDNEFPAGSEDAKREGHRTTLATPLLREGVPIGVILIRRWEIRPFYAKQIALLENFADQAVIAIENARLFEAEKQRSLALVQANRDLAEREARIRRLVEADVVGIFIWGLEGRIMEANDAFLRMVGYDRADLVSGLVHRRNLTPPEWRDCDERTITELKMLGTVAPFEKEYYRKDSSRVPVLIGLSRFEEGGNEGVAFVVDLTERKRAEEALRESEAKFRDYAETASDWFWEIGPDYKFTLLTENAFGSNAAHRIGTTCWEYALDLETEPEKWRLVRAALDSRKPFRDFVYCAAGGNGSPMYVQASGKPVFDVNGEFRGYRGTGTDVTATMRAQRVEASLQTVQAELAHVGRVSTLGQLTASIAHEVTQPIASARNNARAALNFLDRQTPDLGQVKEALECVMVDADRAGDIIDRIRDHIKKVPPKKDRVDLNEAINEVIVLARSAITENGVSVQTRLTEGPLLVQGDRVQVQQVVLNLILNAVEAMASVEAGARALQISTEQSETNAIVVAVRDSGPGVDTKSLERVFEAFYTTKSNGVGMGLSICRSIIEAHGGRLWAEANEPRGAVFQFTLPNENL